MSLDPQASLETPTVVVGDTTFHLPYADLLPPLGDNELDALRADIAERQAVIVPIVIDEARNVIDGANRLRIAAQLGIRKVPVEIRVGLSDADKQQLAEDLNLHRRHLSREQLRLFVERRLKRTPEQSNRRIAAELGVDKNTVESFCSGLQATGQIAQLNKNADGKARPAHRRSAVIRGLGLRQAARVAEVRGGIRHVAANLDTEDFDQPISRTAREDCGNSAIAPRPSKWRRQLSVPRAVNARSGGLRQVAFCRRRGGRYILRDVGKFPT